MNKQATISSRAASDEPLSVSQPPIHREWRINRFERFLFPRSQWVNFVVIALLSTALSFALVGRQVFLANWGLIDDHEVFHFLGPNLHLPISDIWNTLLEKTEVGTLQGRFRPSYYFIKVLETALLGTNVHLWYLGNTIGFAIFLSSVWWALRRFVGGWLSGVLTLSIALLPLWSGIWSRLGPMPGSRWGRSPGAARSCWSTRTATNPRVWRFSPPISHMEKSPPRLSR